MSSEEPERQLLHYRLINKVGEGGMGQVYRAEKRNSDASSPSSCSPPTPRAIRLRSAEAQSASVLNHPNIVTIHAIEEADGVDFIVMEFVTTRLCALIFFKPLSTYCRGGPPWPPSVCTRIQESTASSLRIRFQPRAATEGRPYSTFQGTPRHRGVLSRGVGN